jgi:tetratricopeptide (TPR) repeat protein
MKAVVAREGLVLAMTQHGDLPLAEEQLEAISNTLSDFGNDEKAASAFYRLGLVQEELSRLRDAEASYEEALSLYSSLGMLDDPRAKEMAVRLERIRKQLT